MSDCPTFHAVEAEQDGVKLYSGFAQASDILRVSKVDEYRADPDEERGYQRPPERSRGLAMARYLSREPFVPTAVVLSFREDLGNRVKHASNGFVEITFESDDVVWQVDGQHRLFGVRIAIDEDGEEKIKNLPIPFVLFTGLSEEDEARQFRIINEEAKKVRTDLARRLLVKQARKSGRASAIVAGRDWEVRVTDISAILMKIYGSPWAGRIQPPGAKKRQEHVIKELSFTNSLKPLVSASSPVRKWSDEKLAKALNEYWSAWRSLTPNSFNVDSNSVIMKTPGVFSLHRVADYVFEYFLNQAIEFTEVEFRGVLGKLGEMASYEFWRADNPNGAAMFGSMKGFGILADLMTEQLKDLGFEIE
jgi:DGQHR domain-containing protein